MVEIGLWKIGWNLFLSLHVPTEMFDEKTQFSLLRNMKEAFCKSSDSEKVKVKVSGDGPKGCQQRHLF